MGWYSVISNFASEQITGRDRNGDFDNGSERDGPAMFNGPDNGPEPEYRTYQGTMPLLDMPSRMEPEAVDRVYTAFDVSQPVGQPDDLRGRDREVRALLSGVLHRRNHGVVSGPRGSGKTSLVRVFGQCADREGVVVLYSACDDGTSFGELMRSYLEQIPPSMVDAGSVEQFEQRVLSFGSGSSPYQATGVLAMLKYSQLVIVLDEFDRITDRDMHDKISSLLKLVSDARLPVRFVVVGGNSVFADIVRAHPSLMRHMTRVSTAPLADEAIGELLDRCGQRCGLRFDEGARRLIARLSCGSPYHARLFGMHGALNALAVNTDEVSLEHVEGGLEDAFEEWASLNPEDAAVFEEIIRGVHGPRQELVHFASQVAYHTADDELAAQWKLKRRNRTGEEPGGLAGLGNTIQVKDGHVAFRDATAPQFLLALDQSRRIATPQMKGSQRA
jgi:hypothetical protein